MTPQLQLFNNDLCILKALSKTLHCLAMNVDGAGTQRDVHAKLNEAFKALGEAVAQIEAAEKASFPRPQKADATAR